MHDEITDSTASPTACAEPAQADRREVLRADLMGLADELDRHRDVARLYATGDLGTYTLPQVVCEYLDSLPAVFGQLCALVDNDLLEQIDHLDGFVSDNPPAANSNS